MAESDILPARFEHTFEPDTWTYGAALAVEDLRLEPAADATVVTARVLDGEAFDVYLRIEAGELEGDCSCPLGFDCAHVAAAIQAAAAPRAASTRPGASFDGVAEAAADYSPVPAGPSPAAAPEPAARLWYRLDVDDDPPALRVRPLQVQAAEDGTWGPPEPFAPRRALGPFPPPLLAPADVAILRALARAPDPGNAGIALGPDGGTLLRALIETGRARLGGDPTPLAAGAPMAARLEWQLLADGSQRPRCVPERSGATVLPLVPPWYADPATGACAPLDCGLPTTLAERLLTAPPIPPHAARQAAAALDYELGTLAVPRPRPKPLRVPIPRPPVPHLHLYGIAIGDDSGTHALPAARLSFDYGDAVFSWDAAGNSVIGTDEVIRVLRERRDEGLAVARLREAGLRPLLQCNGLDYPAADAAAFIAADRAHEAVVWHRLQEAFPGWQREGWHIEYGPDFGYRTLTPERWYGDLRPARGGRWFDLDLGVEVAGERIPLLPVLLEWLGAAAPERLAALNEAPDDEPLSLRIDATRVLQLPAARIRGLTASLVELLDAETRLRRERLRLPRTRAAAVAAEEDTTEWSGAAALQGLAQRLRDFTGIPTVTPPPGLAAELRPYQRRGLDWLQFLREYELGGILADDMGLGKTLQTLAHLLLEKRAGRLDRPALVVAPTSLVPNWRAEAARFAPDLKVLALHGPQRSRDFPHIPGHDLVLTTYPLLPRDGEVLAAQPWHLLVLDEAQAIKNPRTQAGRQVRELEARHRLCLTGTPLENHLGELWALFDFLLPGLLGSAPQFRRLFRNPIERDGDSARGEALARRVRPFFLRRLKTEVAADLPPKSEILHSVELEGAQRELYETIRLAMQERVRDALEHQGLERSRIVVLDALLKLRQVCCDPRLLQSDRQAGSAKLDLLMQLLPEMLEEGRRVLLFSQFTSMLALIERELEARGIPYAKLTGRTRDRAEPVERFQAGEVALFLISLKAGGTGLNLTAADTVIHYDPWWNPAAEDQATDRAHRIGQRNRVFVYRLLTEGTVEERIHALQARKRGMLEQLFGSGGAGIEADDLEALFEPLDDDG